MLDDKKYNQHIFDLVDDIQKNSGAWLDFSAQITGETAMSLKVAMESPAFKTDIKALFEKADAGDKGYVAYGSQSFQAFIDLCIDHFKLPKPKGGELVYRKLFNRFQSEQKLSLEECEVLTTTICNVIIRSFNLNVASSLIDSEMVEQIKASEAWQEFKQSLKDQGYDPDAGGMLERLNSGDLKQMFDDADKTKAGELSWARGEALPFMKTALGSFGFPEPKGGEMVYLKMFRGFAKLNGKAITYDECVHMITVALTVAMTDK